MKRSRSVLVLGMVAVIALFFVFDLERFFTLERSRRNRAPWPCISRGTVPVP